MFQSPVNCFFLDVLSNQNMVRVIEGKIIWNRGIKKLHVRLVSERFELSIEGSIPCYRGQEPITKAACVASVSSRVRRESWDENKKKKNDGGGGGE